MATATNANEETQLQVACRAGRLEIVRQLLDASPSPSDDINNRNGANQSALFIACSNGRWEVALELCNRMTCFATDETGSLAALLMAASKGCTGDFQLMGWLCLLFISFLIRIQGKKNLVGAHSASVLFHEKRSHYYLPMNSVV